MYLKINNFFAHHRVLIIDLCVCPGQCILKLQSPVMPNLCLPSSSVKRFTCSRLAKQAASSLVDYVLHSYHHTSQWQPVLPGPSVLKARQGHVRDQRTDLP